VAALFLFSGATALIGEVVWMRMLGLALGNTIWAATTAVAVWMGGMALGSWIGARLATRVRAHLRWYGAAEAVIGLFYLLSPYMHAALLRLGALLGPDLGSSLVVGLMQRFLLALVALILPTTLMGVTLPLLVERVRSTALARGVSLLYGANTLGATLGVFAATYLCLPWLGERGSLHAASVLCLVVALTAFLAERRSPQVAATAHGPRTSSHVSSYLVLVGAMGASALAAELVWIRIMVLHLGSRVYAFALVLGVYLFGIAIGSVAVWASSRVITNPSTVLRRVQLAVAVALCCQMVGLGYAGELMIALAEAFHGQAGFAFLQLLLLMALAILFLPVTVLFGASFPLAVAADPATRSAGAHAGIVAAANTLGAIVGALGAPFLLIPLLGCQRTLLLLVLVHLVVACSLARWRLRAILATCVVGLAGAVGVLWWSLPGDWVLRRAGNSKDADIELVAIEESHNATVLVKRYKNQQSAWLSLELNGVNVAGSDPALLAVQQLQGNLPLLQLSKPSRVLHVGFGSGGTCWAVSQYPLEEIDVVEISPEVLRAADRYFSDINHHVLRDPRVNVVLNDGRNYLLATSKTYDAILSDSIHPVYAGNSTLYTYEYFQLCRDRLAPGGVVSMWLPLYSLDSESFVRILASFHQVFPNTYVWYDITTINENTIVSGKVEPGPLFINWPMLEVKGVAASLAIAGINRPQDIIASIVLGPREVAALVAHHRLHEDDLPFVEYTAGRTMFRELTWYENLRLLYNRRSSTAAFSQLASPATLDRRDEHLRMVLDTLLARFGTVATPTRGAAQASP